jgi:S-adenosylmethionine:tRNA-ribosyltransferase-isomerase (queuine synthetase)
MLNIIFQDLPPSAGQSRSKALSAVRKEENSSNVAAVGGALLGTCEETDSDNAPICAENFWTRIFLCASDILK